MTPPNGVDELPSARLPKVRARLADNGARWTALHLLGKAAGGLQTFFEARARAIERSAGLPGINSVERNRTVWDTYDWSTGGEEWTISGPWLDAVVVSFIDPYLPDGAAILEIGPGAGRWTELLHKRCSQLYLADIAQTTLDLCRQRLGDAANVEYFVTDGASLGPVPDQSVDFLWSFDVFVHIAPAEQQAYAAEFARVLRPRAVAVIHHGDGGLHGGWRSAMTAGLFRTYMEKAGLTVLDQRNSWGADAEFRPTIEGDVVSVIRA